MRFPYTLFVSCLFISHDQASTVQPRRIKGGSSGAGWAIFRPFSAIPSGPQILSSPDTIISHLEKAISRLDTKIIQLSNTTPRSRAIKAYMQMLISHVTGTVYGSSELSITPALGQDKVTASGMALVSAADKRAKGEDWSYLGLTMAGTARMENIIFLLESVFKDKTHGSFVETGVWRGGSSIMARGIIQAHDQGHRISYICDSFRGLPPGRKEIHSKDVGWDKTAFLEVSASEVSRNFNLYSLLDNNVIFVKGFFNDSMPHLRRQIGPIAVLRMDGDMYESTADVLFHLYDKVSIRGYVIVDDWFGFPARDACEDFFRAHGIWPQMFAIDALSAYWRKEEEVTIRFESYKNISSTVEGGGLVQDEGWTSP